MMSGPSRTRQSSCSRSLALSKPASALVVTSMACRRRPAATRGSTFSSRWKRIVLGMTFPKLLGERGRTGLGPDAGDELLVCPNVGVDLGPVGVVVSQGSVHLGQGQFRVSGDDLFRRLAEPLVPDGDVLHLDPVARDVRLPAGIPRPNRYVTVEAGRWRVGARRIGA